MSPSERNLDKELPQLGTITSKFHSFFEAPPIFEVALIAKPAGVKSSYTSGGHSPVEVAAPFVATAGWLVSLLTSTCEVWAVWNGFGHTQPITCSSQQFKDLALCFFFSSAPMSQNGSLCNRDHKCLCNCWFSWW